MDISTITYADAVDHTLRYLGGGPSDVVLADVREAVDAAYREIYGAHRWTYYYKHGRINTNAPFREGTVTYDSDTLTLTLSDPDGFPNWAVDGLIRIGQAIYRPASQPTPDTLVMDSTLAPSSSISEPTQYVLFRDTYILPEDFVSSDKGLSENSFCDLQYTHPREWLYDVTKSSGIGQPRAYTITGDARSPGRLFLRMWPAPDAVKAIDYVYQRSARPLRFSAVTSGSMSLVDDELTASTSVFSPYMVGSVIRLGGKTPASRFGHSPPTFESTIATVVDATHATISDHSPASFTNSAYIISDPIDIEPKSMSTAFMRCCEHMVGITRIMKDKPDARLQYKEALIIAKERDSRSFARRVVGDGAGVYSRINPVNSYPEYPEVEP